MLSAKLELFCADTTEQKIIHNTAICCLSYDTDLTHGFLNLFCLAHCGLVVTPYCDIPVDLGHDLLR